MLQDPNAELGSVTVYGLGWTGVAVANLAARVGKRVIATDTRSPEALRGALDGLASSQGLALDPRVEIRHGAHQPHGSDAVLLTQSVKHFEVEHLDVPVVPEVEFAAAVLAQLGVPLLAVGGTDGKTTTVKLVHELCAAQRPTAVGGNSWPPLSHVVGELANSCAAGTVLVAEISAFQLPPWSRFHPGVAALTNIAEDHVEEYFQGSFDAYVEAKRAICRGLTASDFAVLNMDDPLVRALEPALAQRGVEVIGTSLSARAVAHLSSAAYRHNGELRVRFRGAESGVMAWDDVPLVGDHNAENCLTALGSVLSLDLDMDGVRGTLKGFSAPHHRLEHVARVDGVDYYDDSKATNVHASLAGLSAFGARPLVAIVGGVDKGLDLGGLAQSLASRAHTVIVIGELRARLLDEHRDVLGYAVEADSLEDAVTIARRAAREGDAVVLSPACSSFDMFRSYAHRGQVFQDLVRALGA